MKETKMHSKDVYQSNFLRIEEDTVITSENIETKRIVIRHPGASAILPITNDHKIVLIKQFRYPIDAVTIEVPAGKLEEHEDPILCASRECEEEAHVIPEKIEHVMSIHNCLGYSDEVIHLYLGYGCKHSDDPLPKDIDEAFEILYYTKKEVQALLDHHVITDAKTIILLQHYLALPSF
jgi:ADP-ribose pyrophosphatase